MPKTPSTQHDNSQHSTLNTIKSSSIQKAKLHSKLSATASNLNSTIRCYDCSLVPCKWYVKMQIWKRREEEAAAAAAEDAEGERRTGKQDKKGEKSLPSAPTNRFNSSDSERNLTTRTSQNEQRKKNAMQKKVHNDDHPPTQRERRERERERGRRIELKAKRLANVMMVMSIVSISKHATKGFFASKKNKKNTETLIQGEERKKNTKENRKEKKGGRGKRETRPPPPF